jgi:TolB-like protein
MATMLDELVFEVAQEADSGFLAQGLTEDIITETNTWDELPENVREAVRAFHFDSPAPRRIRLRLVRDDTFTLA